MNKLDDHNERIATMKFYAVYPHYVTKVEKKDRTTEELHEVIEWLTGFNKKDCEQLIADEVTFDEFFQKANLHKNADQITGVICGYRIEEIENPLTKKVRYLDKLVDELAKGKSMNTILRN